MIKRATLWERVQKARRTRGQRAWERWLEREGRGPDEAERGEMSKGYDPCDCEHREHTSYYDYGRHETLVMCEACGHSWWVTDEKYSRGGIGE